MTDKVLNSYLLCKVTAGVIIGCPFKIWHRRGTVQICLNCDASGCDRPKGRKGHHYAENDKF
ncbi:hypothetical protein DXA36_24345 [Eisenbergiella sp. OF01-20]|nr:hypothetical protein DXA36_24345 [Eisenbergiella sp. OF01-20]